MYECFEGKNSLGGDPGVGGGDIFYRQVSERGCASS